MIFAAIDWAEQKHFVVLLDKEGQVLDRQWIEHEHFALAHLDWLLTHRGPVEDVHVAIELHDSLLLDRLLRLGVKVYGINPKSAERARERFTPAGIKDDERDAWSLAEFLRTSYQHLRPLRPDSPATLALCEWVSLREDLIQERTVQLQRLRDHLVRWHPHALKAVGELNCTWALVLLEQFPTADAFAALTYSHVTAWAKGRRLRSTTLDRLGTAASTNSPTTQPARNEAHATEVRHRVQTIRMLNTRLAEVDAQLKKQIAQHPDAFILQSLPNCGTVTVSAMLAGFGEDRERWSGHEEVAARWGVAPVTIESGKHRTVRRRRACDTTLHQAWLWFAFNTVRKQGCWAREDYQAKRKTGTDHYTALRAIADRWVKIAYRCWHDRKPYDESYHQRRRAERMQSRMTS
jgi:hypothetical protein